MKPFAMSKQVVRAYVSRYWYVYILVLLLPYLVLRPLRTRHNHNTGIIDTNSTSNHLPTVLHGVPLPQWGTPEERALLAASMKRWQFSVGLCDGCSAYHQKRLISPSASICSPTRSGKNPELLILVSTIHKQRQHRTMIRQTWGSHTHNNTGRVRLLFLFGLDPARNLTAERMLQEEGAAHGDILQEDFNSTYRRGGEIQLIMGYTWVIKHCSNIMHVLKISDDTFVNVPKVLELISTVDLKNTVWGEAYFGSRPVRKKGHRWYTSPQEWPAAGYGAYTAGAYLGVTVPVIRKILLIFPYVAWTAGADDVIVGKCAEKMGIPIKKVPGFFVWKGNDPCKIRGAKYAIHFHGHPAKTHKDFFNRKECFVPGSAPKKAPVPVKQRVTKAKSKKSPATVGQKNATKPVGTGGPKGTTKS